MKKEVIKQYIQYNYIFKYINIELQYILLYNILNEEKLFYRNYIYVYMNIKNVERVQYIIIVKVVIFR